MTWYDKTMWPQLGMTTYLTIMFCFLFCLPLSIPSGYLAFRLRSNQNFDLSIQFILRLFKLNFLGTIFNKHTAFVLLYNGNKHHPFVDICITKCHQHWDCPSPVAASCWLWAQGRRTPETGCVRSSGTSSGYPSPPPAPGPSSLSCSGELVLRV